MFQQGQTLKKASLEIYTYLGTTITITVVDWLKTGQIPRFKRSNPLTIAAEKMSFVSTEKSGMNSIPQRFISKRAVLEHVCNKEKNKGSENLCKLRNDEEKRV